MKQVEMHPVQRVLTRFFLQEGEIAEILLSDCLEITYDKPKHHLNAYKMLTS